MRHFIIGLSVILFVLSGIITTKAFKIPGNKFRYQNSQQSVKPEKQFVIAAEILDKDTKEQKDQPVFIEASQIATPSVEDKPENKSFAVENLVKDTKEQKNNRVFIEESQTTTPSVEDKPENKNKVIKGALAKNPGTLSLLVTGVFPSGQVGIDEKLMNSVKELIPHILALPDHRIIIEGHTDNIPIGPSISKFKDNKQLSYFRARALAKLLEKKGVPLERITVIGHGDAFPIASNESKAGRFRNRRVEIKLIPHDKEL